MTSSNMGGLGGLTFQDMLRRRQMHESSMKKLDVDIMQREVDLGTLESQRDQHRGAYSELGALIDQVAKQAETIPSHDPTADADQ